MSIPDNNEKNRRVLARKIAVNVLDSMTREELIDMFARQAIEDFEKHDSVFQRLWEIENQ